jgi:hypothetical protein
MKRVIALSVLIAVMLTCTMAVAVPGLINYQGKLTDSRGEPLNGTYSMRFDLYNSSSGGSSLWNETQNVNVNSGMYDVHLGASATLPATLFAANDILYLQVSIRNSSGVYEALSPRQRLTSSPYAMQAADADTLGGMTPGSFATSAHNHDSRYYTQSQVNTLLGGKSDTTHTHDGRYYTKPEVDTRLNTKANTTHSHSGSDITSGTISLSGSVAGDAIIKGTNSNTTGRGVLGVASNTGSVTNYGGYFTAAGSSGRGVHAEAQKAGFHTNYGGYFSAAGDFGKGVFGQATGPVGRGVEGVAPNTGDFINYGGYFTAAGIRGRAVYGNASSTGDLANYGGYFTAAGYSGRGVYGAASGRYGIGVHGLGSYFGGYFEASGPQGRGVSVRAPEGFGVFVEGWYGGVDAIAHSSNSTGVAGGGGAYDFYATGPGVNYAPFTGAHEVLFAQDMPMEIVPGMIVSATGKAKARVDDSGVTSLSSTLPTVTLSSKAMDKAVFGVLVRELPLRKDHWYQAQEGERSGVVNAVGEGRMLVCDVNGNIEAGDYITSSDIPGYGQLQNDDILRSYTVGKAIETVDWDAVTDTVYFDGRPVKVYLIAVVYTSG